MARCLTNFSRYVDNFMSWMEETPDFLLPLLHMMHLSFLSNAIAFYIKKNIYEMIGLCRRFLNTKKLIEVDNNIKT